MPDSTPRDPAPPTWDGLLDAVAGGQLRLTFETLHGGRVVALTEVELAALTRAPAVDHRVCLTTREREVLACLATGQSVSQVATSLGLAANTVAQHLSTVRHKYGVSTSRAAVALARQDGQLDQG